MQTIEEDVAVELATTSNLKTLPEWHLSRVELRFLNKTLLGEGGFGCVYSATWLNSTVAVKEMILDPTQPRKESFDPFASTREASTTAVTATDREAEMQAALTMFRREADVWFRLNHPHVVQLFGACDGNDVDQPPIFVCEYATNGPLNKYLREHPDQMLEKLHEVALGVQYLHERDIVHGDLKCNNIVVGSDLKAKVTDFGLSAGSNQVEGAGTPISGAVQWVAPECLSDTSAPALAPTAKSDIYSLGMIIIEAMRVVEGVRLTDEKCFLPYPWGNSDPGAVKNQVKTQQKLPPRPSICSDEQWALITRMCAYEADARININTVVHELAMLARAGRAGDATPEIDRDELEDVNSFRGGDLVRQREKALQLSHEHGDNPAVVEAVRELEALFGQIQRSRHPRSVLRRLSDLIDDFRHTITDGGFQQFRVLDAMALHSVPSTVREIYLQIDACWTDLGLQAHEVFVEIQARRSRHVMVQHALIISEETNSWMLLPDLKTEDDRGALLAYLRFEIEAPDYTPEQLFLMQQACDAIAEAPALSKLTTMPKWFVLWLELEIEPGHPMIEVGSFGRVYIAKWLGSTVAVKEMFVPERPSLPSWGYSSVYSDDDLDEPDSPQNARGEILSAFTREVEIWFSLSHPHVVRLYGACHIGTPFFVSEYGSNGPLDQYLRRHPDQIWQKLHEAALGIEYLHERGVIHGSLKCNDIVVTSDGKAKVTDFGVSSFASAPDDERGTVRGAYRWKAPECLDGAAPTMEADIYSLGMCVVEALLVAGSKEHRVPWGYMAYYLVKYHVLHKRLLPPRPDKCTDNQWALVTSMCQFNPQDRISSSAVVEELARIAAASVIQH